MYNAICFNKAHKTNTELMLIVCNVFLEVLIFMHLAPQPANYLLYGLVYDACVNDDFCHSS